MQDAPPHEPAFVLAAPEDGRCSPPGAPPLSARGSSSSNSPHSAAALPPDTLHCCYAPFESAAADSAAQQGTLRPSSAHFSQPPSSAHGASGFPSSRAAAVVMTDARGAVLQRRLLDWPAQLQGGGAAAACRRILAAVLQVRRCGWAACCRGHTAAEIGCDAGYSCSRGTKSVTPFNAAVTPPVGTRLNSIHMTAPSVTIFQVFGYKGEQCYVIGHCNTTPIRCIRIIQDGNSGTRSADRRCERSCCGRRPHAAAAAWWWRVSAACPPGSRRHGAL